ncbi:MAG: hypothetical protein LH614_22010 [Pyrinomonadaceae bacterium]|nr:hypothetical protein [Pyrinomonadaceae bacterium]
MPSENKSSVLLFFIDGLGIGERGEKNPLANIENLAPLVHFVNENAENAEIVHDGVLILTDARLGIEGRPQSASGQTTILTGINAPQLLGNHKQGFPNQILRDLIAEHSIFRQLKQKNIEPNVFANAYTPKFFTEKPRWKSATTCAVEAAALPFRQLPDLLGRKAIFHDFTNQSLIEQNFDVPHFSPPEAGEILAGLTAEHRFTLYEYFITDKIGHAQNFEAAQTYLPPLAAFLRAVLQRVDLKTTTVILTSDHGNIEDFSVRTHTLNDVPTIIWGRRKLEAAAQIKDLSDITPTILNLLSS